MKIIKLNSKDIESAINKIRRRQEKDLKNIERKVDNILDILVDQNSGSKRTVYICYSSEVINGTSTSLLTGEIKGDELIKKKVLFRANNVSDSGVHFGCRLAILGNEIFMSIGDRGNRNQAQLLTTPNGKIHRLNDDGSIPEDNPFVNKPDAQKSIWTYGNRNPQGLVIDKKTSSIFSAEHGPRGGDELNVIEKGKNYGWPEITYGINYIGTKITKYTHKEGMEQPITHWTPSIAVSYTHLTLPTNREV